ncbi:MAG: nuclear transport factor 2 family protein [Microvirga sp.]
MSNDPEALVRRWFAIWLAADREAAEAIVAEDFHFTSPLDNRLDRNAFFERCWPNSETMGRFDIVRLVATGQTVMVTYELALKSGKRFRNTEAITVDRDQVREAEVYFGWDLPHKAPDGGFIDG